MQLENIYVRRLFGDNPPEYRMESGKFRRTFTLPGEAVYTEEQTGDAIGNYVATFDEMLKGYLSGEYRTTQEMENRYLEYLNSGVALI